MTVRRSSRGKWMIDICHNHPDGRETRIRKVSPVQTRRGAEAHERKLRQLLEAGHLGKEPTPNTQPATGAQHTAATPAAPPSIAEFAPRFITEHCEVEQHRPSTIRSARTILRKHITPAVGAVRIDQICSKHFGVVKRAMVKRRSTVQAKTINNVLTVLSRMVRFWYEREGKTPPRINAGLLRLDQKEAEFYEPEEFEELVAGATKAGPQELALVLLMGDAGLRQGEVRALQWSDIRKQPEPALRIRRSRDLVVEQLPKGKKGRSVTLTPRLAAALEALPRHRGEPHVFVNDEQGGVPLTAKAVKVRVLRAEAMPETGLSHKLGHYVQRRILLRRSLKWVPGAYRKQVLGHALSIIRAVAGRRDAVVRLVAMREARTTGWSGRGLFIHQPWAVFPHLSRS